MKKIFLIFTSLFFLLNTQAQQPVTGTTYYLPKTALRFSFLIEKTTYTPGQFAAYSGKYLKKTDVSLEPSTTYRIAAIRMTPTAMPDSAKQYTLMLDKKISITEVDRDPTGILLAINTKGKGIEEPAAFKPATQKPILNPRNYMNEDILTAGSTAKMAELCAQDIYEIRDSRAQLSRGQADFMPKDGAQLKIMMDNLDTQEAALLQTFEGITQKDTTETILTFIPAKSVEKQLFFRFSKWTGITDLDDLGGAPYYISISDEQNIPENAPVAGEEKKSKEDFGLYVNIPDKIKVTLYKHEQPLKTYELWAGQFGKTENLSSELFGKKTTTRLLLNPLTGSIEKIESEIQK